VGLALHNTLTRQLAPFAPLAPPRVTLYTCGPTVWNFAHIGNFRTFLFEDLLRRWLEASGYDVFHVMNLTDVDDRIIRAASAAGRTVMEHTAPFVQAFFEDSDFLRIRRAHVYPRATGSIPAMLELVERLLAVGVAYRADDGSVYFAIDRFPTYGRLSQLDRRTLKVGARVASDEYAKDDPRDFALWKRASAEDERVGAAWDASFGRGRPGWHLECSAMSLNEIKRRFGVETLDIHCGGVDLIFPHHEDEIAQSEAATGQPFARYWLHGAFLNVKGTKMSKRFGNFLTVRDLKENGVKAGTFRHLVFSTHYRQELDFSDQSLASAREGALRLGEFDKRLRDVTKAGLVMAGGDWPPAREFLNDFGVALDDDLNAPQALARTHDFVREANRLLDDRRPVGEALMRAWETFKQTLDAHAVVSEIELQASVTGTATMRATLAEDPPPDEAGVEEWAKEWAQARVAAKQARDYERADQIRELLRKHGFEIRDRTDGTAEVVRR
jgi:cysteinyl-tRNA synthetase